VAVPTLPQRHRAAVGRAPTPPIVAAPVDVVAAVDVHLGAPALCKHDEGSGKIVDARFKTFGCGSAIASSSVATEWVKGKQMEEVVAIKNTDIAKHLSLPPVKLYCSMLAEDAIKAAVKDYEAKKGKLAKADE